MAGFYSIVSASAFAVLLFAAGSATAAGDTATLSWIAPTVNADGSKLSDLLGFNVYRGTSPATMMLAASVPAYTNSFADANLTPSVWYWYITAVNSMGVESAPSPLVSKAITASGAGSTTGGTNSAGSTNSAGGTTAATAGSTGGPAGGSTTGSSTSGSSSGSTSGSTTGSTAGSSSGDGAASPYRESSLASATGHSHCRPAGMVTCSR